jgi:hypothetical protein
MRRICDGCKDFEICKKINKLRKEGEECTLFVPSEREAKKIMREM